MIKLVALDVDGTLVDRSLQILPRTREAIAKARARGVQFAIVTGRMYQAAVPFARELGLEGMPLIAYNGALVKEYPSGRTISHQPLQLEVAKALAAFCEARGYHLQAYVDDELYVPDLGPLTDAYVAVARVKPYPVGSIFLWLQKSPTKMLVVDDQARIPQIHHELQELLGAAVHVTHSMPRFAEVTSDKATKGLALEAVAQSLGLDRTEVMAIGDGMNDISMLTWAGTSFAMANGPEALRKAATHVTESGPGEGVAEALERMGLI